MSVIVKSSKRIKGGERLPSVPSRKKGSRRREAEEIEQFIRSRGGKKMSKVIKQRLQEAGCDDWPEE